MVGSLANRTWNLLRLVRGAPVALKMFARRGLLLLVPTILLCIGSVKLFAQSAAAQSAATDAPDANPGRPTVSTPATLTPVAYLQFETGVLGASKIHRTALIQRRDLELFELAVRHFVGPGA